MTKWGEVNWFHLAQGRDKQQALANSYRNHRRRRISWLSQHALDAQGLCTMFLLEFKGWPAACGFIARILCEEPAFTITVAFGGVTVG